MNTHGSRKRCFHFVLWPLLLLACIGGHADVVVADTPRLSPDGARLYVTNSLLSSLDGEVEFGAWLFHVGPQGLRQDERFRPNSEQLAGGRAGPHDILLR